MITIGEGLFPVLDAFVPFAEGMFFHGRMYVCSGSKECSEGVAEAEKTTGLEKEGPFCG